MKTVFFAMILHPLKGWTRVGNAYSSRKSAQSWLGFVRSYWHLRAKVASCTLTLVNGQPDERSRRVLDTKFNLDPPTGQAPP